MTARWTTDAEARALAAANDPERRHKRRWSLQGSLVVMAGVAGFVVGVWW